MKSIISILRKHGSTNNIMLEINGAELIKITFNASTQWGRDLHVSNSPCPNCPRRPSPHVKTICSLVNAIMCEPLTLTYWICYLYNVQEVMQPPNLYDNHFNSKKFNYLINCRSWRQLNWHKRNATFICFHVVQDWARGSTFCRSCTRTFSVNNNSHVRERIKYFCKRY